jgi:phage/plasmid-associated DNA primase
VRAASDEYADAMDSLGLWLAECCLRTGDRDDGERAGLLYRSYSDWKKGRGEAPVSTTRWGEQMRSRGVERHRTRRAKPARCRGPGDPTETEAEAKLPHPGRTTPRGVNQQGAKRETRQDEIR